MPDSIACPRCRKRGLVRMERVIRGGGSLRAYYCGACDHTWQISDAPGAESLTEAADFNPEPSRPGGDATSRALRRPRE